MPGDIEIVLECATCGAHTRYRDLYQHGKLTVNHKLDCSAQTDGYPKMYLHQAKTPPSI